MPRVVRCCATSVTWFPLVTQMFSDGRLVARGVSAVRDGVHSLCMGTPYISQNLVWYYVGSHP